MILTFHVTRKHTFIIPADNCDRLKSSFPFRKNFFTEMKNMSSLIFKQRPWQVDGKIRGSDKKKEEGRAFTFAATFSSLSVTLPPTSTSFSTPLMHLLLLWWESRTTRT